MTTACSFAKNVIIGTSFSGLATAVCTYNYYFMLFGVKKQAFSIAHKENKVYNLLGLKFQPANLAGFERINHR